MRIKKTSEKCYKPSVTGHHEPDAAYVFRNGDGELWYARNLICRKVRHNKFSEEKCLQELRDKYNTVYMVDETKKG